MRLTLQHLNSNITKVVILDEMTIFVINKNDINGKFNQRLGSKRPNLGRS